MNPVTFPVFLRCFSALILVAGLTIGRVAPAAAQTDVLVVNGTSVGLSPGATASAARGIAKRGFEPIIIVGTQEMAHSNASCWIRVSNVWQAHVLPGLDAARASWANAVDHVPDASGEWVAVVGAAVDGAGVQKPMVWNNVKNMPWTQTPLPTLNAGTGEAHTLFLPDGTPLRAMAAGWSGEMAPTTTGGATASASAELRIPVIWEVTTTGERIMQPEFGAGLEGHVKDIGPLGAGVFAAFGGGQTTAGGWSPQMWTSTDDGTTWTNEALPLPPGTASGEATDFDVDAQGLLFVAGWGQSAAAGTAAPLLWERDTASPVGSWLIHELPLPTGAEGGQNGSIHKLPGRTKYSNITLKRGLTGPDSLLMTLWVDDGAGWVVLEPSDYLANPGIGTPIFSAGFNRTFGIMAATIDGSMLPLSAGTSVEPVDTFAAVLIPSPPTGVGGSGRPPSLIALSASPNPFNPGVRIGYTLPREARVRVTIHDAKGRVVSRFDEGLVAAGRERVLVWDGTLPNGTPAASGVYFVRVATPYDISTMKVVKIE